MSSGKVFPELELFLLDMGAEEGMLVTNMSKEAEYGRRHV